MDAVSVRSIALAVCLAASAAGAREPLPSSPAGAGGARRRTGVAGLIKKPRLPKEDRLRTALLTSAESDEERKKFADLVNRPWNKAAAETLAQRLMTDTFQPSRTSMRRAMSISAMLIYVRTHEKPSAFQDGEESGVTVREATRVKEAFEAVDRALAAYQTQLFAPSGTGPDQYRARLRYCLGSALEKYGTPAMLVEPIWEFMGRDKKFRWDMLGVTNTLADEGTLARLIRFRDSRKWPPEDQARIEQGIKDIKWWLERAEWLAKNRPTTAAPPYVVSEQETKAMLQRLAAAKAGRCPSITICGSDGIGAAMQALSVAYTKRHTAVAVRFSPAGEMSAVSSFVLGQCQVLARLGPPSEQALRVHGPKWRALWQTRKDKPGVPEEYILPGRAAAIVVHSLNKLDSLTPAQVRAIFQGTVRDWQHLGALDAKGQADTRIRCHGLYSHTPAGALFEAKAFDKYKRVAVARKKTSAEVLAAMATDPQGIGFVSAAQLPPDAARGGIKVLALNVPDPGAPGKTVPVRPTEADILAGRYPFAQRLHVYVSPNASATTKDFVRFLVTGGRSAANAYTDVPGAVDKVFRAHGLFPPPAPASSPAGGPTRGAPGGTARPPA